MNNPDHPLWQPQTNYDRIGDVTEDELVELWACLDFQGHYADCDKCTRDEFCGFDEKCCPETFRNWLRSEADGQRT